MDCNISIIEATFHNEIIIVGARGSINSINIIMNEVVNELLIKQKINS